MKLAAGAVILGVMLALLMAWKSSTGPQPPSGEEQETPQADKLPAISESRAALPPKRERPRNLRAELMAAFDHPERLIALTPEAGSAGLIEGSGSPGYDASDILQRYQRALFSCTPEQIGRLFRALPEEKRQAVAVKLKSIFKDRNDFEYTAAVMRELPLKDEMKARGYLANQLGQHLTATDPGTVGQTMALLDPSDYEDFGQGLESLIGRIEDPAERHVTIEALFENFQNPELIEPLAGILAEDLARRDPLAALEWVEELPPGTTRSAERVLMTSLAASHPQAGIDYGNKLIQSGQHDQAAKAFEIFAARYSR